MSSHDWSYTLLDDIQAVAPAGAPAAAYKLGQWSAEPSASSQAHRYQHARYVGQAAAVLLGVVGVCCAIGQVVFG